MRRIEAVTGGEAFKLANLEFKRASDLSKIFSCKNDDIVSCLSVILEKKSKLEAEIKNARNSILSDAVAMLSTKVKVIENGIYEIKGEINGLSTEEIRSVASSLAKKFAEHVIVITSKNDTRTSVVAICSAKAITYGHCADNIVKDMCAINGGNGGGNKKFAMGGF
jgi:alanyl-tRNA synthetase